MSEGEVMGAVRQRMLAGSAAIVLVVSACGSDATTSEDTTDLGVSSTVPAGSAAPTSSEGTAPTPSDVSAPESTAPELDEDAEPIRLGFRNIDAVVPEVRVGFEQGIAYANEVLGGVNGRPLEIAIACSVDGTPEGSVDCANQIVESGVVLSVQGADPAADAALPVLIEAGIAETGIASFGPVQQADVGHSFMFTNPADVAGIAAVVALAEAGAASTIRFFAGDTPVARRYDGFVQSAGDQLGIDAEMIFHPQGAPDWAALVATAQAQDADGIGLMAGSEAECAGMIGAAAQAGFEGPILAGNCQEFAAAVGAETAENVYTLLDLFPPDAAESAPEGLRDEVTSYVEWMTDNGHEDLLSTFASGGFSLAVTIRDALSQVDDGELTAEDVLAGFPSTSGVRFMSGPYRCDGSAWPGTSVCQTNVVVLRQRADGTREVASDGFIDFTEFIPG
jgi:branched-chain amino acid transport system substrate-binding protein